MDRSELYQSKGLGKSTYNNILRKQKASKNMNYCFDIQPTDQQGQILHESLPETAQVGNKETMIPVIKVKKSRAKQSSFSWTKNQERKYISFLRNNGQLFSLTAKERKDIKINVLISSAVRSRTPAQCHSHHQKMIIKHGNIQNIIGRLTDYILSKTRGEAHIRKEERQENIEEKAHSEGTMEAERELQLNTPQQQQPQVEPEWWQYLNLMDDRQQFPWNDQPYFQ